MKPSDNMLRKEYAQLTRLQRTVNADVASSPANPEAETVYNVRKLQEPIETSPMRRLSPAGYQRRHVPKVVAQINASLAGWVHYFRVGNASGAFSEVREYTEMKVRTLLTRRKRRRKTSIGWRRWSNEYLYGVLGLYWDWKVQPLPGVESMS
jgi:hypothetical protein